MDEPEKTQEQRWLSVGEVLARLGLSRQALIERTEPDNASGVYYRSKLVVGGEGGLERVVLERDLKEVGSRK